MNIIVFYTPKKKNIDVVLRKIKESGLKNKLSITEYTGKNENLEEYDLAIAVGGDGTFLKATSFVHNYGIPILGINLGSLGFLTDTREEEIEDVIGKLAKDDFDIQKRMMLHVDYKDKECYALNDAVFSMEEGRMIKLEISIDNHYVAGLSGDGLIISTPTGSTAYSLSSGGPILTPKTKGIVITPICPHTLTFRPLVVDENSNIEIRNEDKCRLMCDGQREIMLNENDRVNIKKSKKLLKIVKIKGKDYFQILREKLNWGNR